MRLFSLALGVVVAFGLGVWGISRFLPNSAPGWLGAALAVTWLYLLIFLAASLTTKHSRKVKDERRLYGYGLLTAMVMAGIMLLLFAYEIELPKWAVEVAFGVIVAGIFLLSRYMTRRRLRSTER